MNITDIGELLDLLEILSRRKSIIAQLFPDKILSQSELAEKTGIAPSNLSKYVSKLKEKKIIEVKQDQNEEGFSVNLVQLRPETKEILNEALKLQTSQEKHHLPDLGDFNKILERLMNPAVQKLAADSVQILSRQYIVPHDSGFLDFLDKHMNDKEIRPVLVVLIKSARSIVGEWSPEEKESVLTTLGSKLQALADKGDPEAIRKETMNLLQELGAYDKPYEELKELYLKQRHCSKDPAFFRSLILRNHREKLMDLWISLMDLYESANEAERQWFEQEFALLR